MHLDKIRRMAADILKIGREKIWLDPNNLEKIAEVMTKEDVRGLISEGIIKKRKEKGQSRARARKLHEKKKKGRKRGYGKRTGKKVARLKPKKEWRKKVRSQRKKLKSLKEEKKLGKLSYTKLRGMIKGGYFKGKKYLEKYIEASAKEADK